MDCTDPTHFFGVNIMKNGKISVTIPLKVLKNFPMFVDAILLEAP